MSTYLWKVTATKNWGSILKGMTVEIVVKNRTGKPSISEIQNAIAIKYSIKVSSGLSESTFDFVKG